MPKKKETSEQFLARIRKEIADYEASIDKTGQAEVVMEKHMGKYRLPDGAIDLTLWLQDGLEVYNLFMVMKPAFFQMLEALGGRFELSWKKDNADRLKNRLHIHNEIRGELGEEGYDQLSILELRHVIDG